MERFVWDKYESPVRLSITLLAMTGAAIMFLAGFYILAGVSILIAAIAFHTEYSFRIDPDGRTYEKRMFVKPFGTPKIGSLDDIHCIGLSLQETRYGEIYQAGFVFNHARYENPAIFTFSSGTLEKVLDDVKRVVKATAIEVIESETIRNTRNGYESIASLVDKRPR